jgi:hypothetical protein
MIFDLGATYETIITHNTIEAMRLPESASKWANNDDPHFACEHKARHVLIVVQNKTFPWAQLHLLRFEKVSGRCQL